MRNTGDAVISDLSAFSNLEYLTLYETKLVERPFQHLDKLIRIKLMRCDLSEFDVDSLNSLTSLQVIEMYTDKPKTQDKCLPPFKIDLSRAVNLKWLKLSLKEENDFELISNDSSFNQLTKFEIFYNNANKTVDFFKRLNLPELKVLDISLLNLSGQISHDWFDSMSKLKILKLENTRITNVDFLNSDSLQNLEHLYLIWNNITGLKKGSFSKLKNLEYLLLQNNKINKLVPGTFDGLDCLIHLDISQNPLDLTSVDKAVFANLVCLRNLSLPYGPLSRDDMETYIIMARFMRPGLAVGYK